MRSLAATQARLIKHFTSRLFRQRDDYYSQAVSKVSARNAWDYVLDTNSGMLRHGSPRNLHNLAK